MGVGIEIAIKEMLSHINIAVRCRRELESLHSVLINLQDINSDMQMYRVALNSGQLKFSENLRPASVDKWLRKLNMLLLEAAEMAQKCTIPTYNIFFSHRNRKNIASMTKSIRKRLDNAATISITTQLAQSLCHVQQSNREMAASTSFRSTLPVTERTTYVGAPHVLGQDMACFVGMGGSGKTLVKRPFNSHLLLDLFANNLLAWLTVSQTPSFEWEFTLRRLQNAEIIKYEDVACSLYGSLRLNYDDLANIDLLLQLCFLYMAAYPAENVIPISEVFVL